MKNRITVKRAFIASLPVMAGYMVLSMGFGILMASKGYGAVWSISMSVFIFAGSLQYIAIDFLTGGASLLLVAMTTFMMNARHLFYGISMIDKYKGAGKKKPYLMFALTDEIFTLCCSGAPSDVENPHLYYFLLSLFNHSYLIIGTALGSLLGNVLPFSSEGMDFALTALFITVFLEQWKSQKKHSYAVIGLIAAVVCVLIFSADNFLIPTMFVIVAALAFLRKKEGGNENA